MSVRTALESASFGRHRATKAEVVPTCGVARSNCVGECRLVSPQGDQGLVAPAQGTQFGLRQRGPPLAAKSGRGKGSSGASVARKMRWQVPPRAATGRPWQNSSSARRSQVGTHRRMPPLSTRTTEAGVALARDVLRLDCVGECRLWPKKGDRSRGSSGARLPHRTTSGNAASGHHRAAQAE